MKLHTFSIIIPALNEEDYISSCLSAIKDQDYPGDFEIIVVDNGSTDKTVAIAQNFGVKVVREPLTGVSHALIKGCSEAKNEVLVFTDADTIVPINWLSQINNCLNINPDIVACGGPYEFYDGGAIFNFFTKHIVMPLYLKLFFPRMKSLSCVNLAVRHDLYEKSGGFNPMIQWGQDAELCQRLTKFGKILFDPNNIVLTSFRRFHGGRVNFFTKNAHIIKETVTQITRYIWIALRNKYHYSAQKPVRVKQVSRARKVINNGATALFLLLVYLIFVFALPSTQLIGGVVHHGVKTHGFKMVALTFDDGPYGEATEQVLNVLRANCVKATFFIVGKNAEKYPELLKREFAEGHLIGNHSYNHSKLLFTASSHKIKRNILKTDSIIYSIIGLHPKYFRPCYGLTSIIMNNTLKHMGYTIILWNVSVKDYDSKESSETITQHILQQLKPGAIILLHDGRDTQINYPRDNMIKALPDIIAGIRKAGYTMVTLDQIINEPPYTQR
ncbi:MAG: polysaccharide deacetylase family protein [candidate division WOR-3 bacterium]